MSSLVSIIIPCYNYAQYITAALQSLQQQTHLHWECWVVDDGSTDETAATIQQIAHNDSRIHYLYQPNQGQPAARNTGLARAHGAYIQFLDADDVLQPSKLAQQVAYLEDQPATDIVYSNVLYFTQPDGPYFPDRWNQPGQDWMPRLSGKGALIVKALVKQNIFELGCALFRKTSIDQVGLFNTALQGVEDYELLFRCALQGHSVHFLDQPDTACLMRHHAGSYSKSLVKMYQRELLLRRQMNGQLKRVGHSTALKLNKNRYNARLRKLHDKLIDHTIKNDRTQVNWPAIRWTIRHTSPQQNCYFVPRILKAFFLTHRSRR